MIPTATAYRPHIVIHNTNTSTMTLLELIYPLDSDHHLESARSRTKLNINDCLENLSFPNFYKILEVSVLGHYQSRIYHKPVALYKP